MGTPAAPTSAPRIFISYNRQDIAFTRTLVGDLERAGAVVWVDWEGARDGDFLRRINQGLERCEWLVLVETPHALASDPVEMEVNAALNRVLYGQMRGVVRLVAAPRDPRTVKPVWAPLQFYDATGDYAGAVAALLAAIRAGDARAARRPGAEHPGGQLVVTPPAPPPTTEAGRYLSRMASASEASDWYTVRNVARLLLDEHPSDVTTAFYQMQGRALLELGRPAEAAQALQQAFDRDRGDIPTMRAAARAYLQANDLAKADPLLLRALTLEADPEAQLDILREYIPTLLTLGERQPEKLTEAQEGIDQALRLRPDDRAWLAARRDLLAKLKRPADALADARALTARPDATSDDWLALFRLDVGVNVLTDRDLAAMPLRARIDAATSLLAEKRGRRGWALLTLSGLSTSDETEQARARAHLFPLPDVPARLASLGFRGVNQGEPAILPPLVSVAAGPFLMGSADSDKQANDGEKPQHRVELAAFQIGKYPVTVVEYALAVRAGAVREPPTASSVTWPTQLQRPDHPVVCVSWQDATAYVAWLRGATGEAGWRLPSEAQWEKAARWDAQRGVSRIYPWGDSFDKTRCNTEESGIGTTTPVGSYPASDTRRSGASPWGAEEMAGNVWEWASSLFKPYPYTESDGREDQKSTDNRTLRGGSWGNGARNARTACRGLGRGGGLDDDWGFRLAWARRVGS